MAKYLTGRGGIRVLVPPDEAELPGGAVGARWEIVCAKEVEDADLVYVAQAASSEHLSVSFERKDGRRIEMQVICKVPTPRNPLHHKAIRAIHLLEARIGPVESIEGEPRRAWATYFY